MCLLGLKIRRRSAKNTHVHVLTVKTKCNFTPNLETDFGVIFFFFPEMNVKTVQPVTVVVIIRINTIKQNIC